jgi:hypothetical protein
MKPLTPHVNKNHARLGHLAARSVALAVAMPALGSGRRCGRNQRKHNAVRSDRGDPQIRDSAGGAEFEFGDDQRRSADDAWHDEQLQRSGRHPGAVLAGM